MPLYSNCQCRHACTDPECECGPCCDYCTPQWHHNGAKQLATQRIVYSTTVDRT